MRGKELAQTLGKKWTSFEGSWEFSLENLPRFNKLERFPNEFIKLKYSPQVCVESIFPWGKFAHRAFSEERKNRSKEGHKQVLVRANEISLWRRIGAVKSTLVRSDSSKVLRIYKASGRRRLARSSGNFDGRAFPEKRANAPAFPAGVVDCVSKGSVPWHFDYQQQQNSSSSSLYIPVTGLEGWVWIFKGRGLVVQLRGLKRKSPFFQNLCTIILVLLKSRKSGLYFAIAKGFDTIFSS